MLSSFTPTDSCVEPDIHPLQSRLLGLLDQTWDKCEKNSVGVDNQERYAMVAQVPRVVENRAKANIAFDAISSELNNIHSDEAVLAFLESPLIKSEGLFFRILRGKINKYLIPDFEPEVQEKIRYQK
ncbi:MAG: hypothetical protein AB7D28_00710 [Candidatus Berkiella sp.]